MCRVQITNDIQSIIFENDEYQIRSFRKDGTMYYSMCDISMGSVLPAKIYELSEKISSKNGGIFYVNSQFFDGRNKFLKYINKDLLLAVLSKYKLTFKPGFKRLVLDALSQSNISREEILTQERKALENVYKEKYESLVSTLKMSLSQA